MDDNIEEEVFEFEEVNNEEFETVYFEFEEVSYEEFENVHFEFEEFEIAERFKGLTLKEIYIIMMDEQKNK